MKTLVSLWAGALLALMAQSAAAQGVTCNVTEQDGCLEFDLMLLHESRHVPEMQELLTHAAPGKRDVCKVLDSENCRIAVDLYKAAKEGRAQPYAPCVPVALRFWGVRKDVSTARMAEYHLGQGARFADSLRPSRLKGTFVESKVQLKENETGRHRGYGLEYRLEVCGGKAALQVPWDYLTADTWVQIEPLAATEFPDRLKAGTRSALWLTPQDIVRMRKGDARARWEWVLIPIIFPESAAPIS